jgi:hypothetical protein
MIEKKLSSNILAKATVSGKEYAWKKEDVFDAINDGKEKGLRVLGGQVQYRLPIPRGICDLYELSYESDPPRMTETWNEFVVRSAKEVSEKIHKLIESKDLVQAGMDRFDTIKKFSKKSGTRVEDYVYFVLYFQEENDLKENNSDLLPIEAQAIEWWSMSPLRAYLLSIITFNLFVPFWVGINWERYKKATNAKIVPFARGVFVGLYIIQLFNKALTTAQKKDYKGTYPSWLLGLVFIILGVASRYLADLPAPWGTIAVLLCILLSPIGIYLTQKAMNFNNSIVISNYSNPKISWVDILIISGISVVVLLILFGIIISVINPSLS